VLINFNSSGFYTTTVWNFRPLKKTISLVQILEEGAGVEVIEFPDMQHGWTVRGDMSDPKVKR